LIRHGFDKPSTSGIAGFHCTALSHARLSAAFCVCNPGRSRARAMVSRKIPTHEREQNVKQNNRALANIGA